MSRKVWMGLGVALVVVGMITWKVMLGMESAAEDAG